MVRVWLLHGVEIQKIKLKKGLTNLLTPAIIKVQRTKEETKMARTNNTRGWYYFADGTEVWFNGLSAREKANEIRRHGAIVRFIHTP